MSTLYDSFDDGGGGLFHFTRGSHVPVHATGYVLNVHNTTINVQIKAKAVSAYFTIIRYCRLALQRKLSFINFKNQS